ncbi:MAG: polysaccharide biosynthesis protein [Clostridia bacterium]|nr:polysaccharide biosynthesis protein [Clostridia bacterium]
MGKLKKQGFLQGAMILAIANILVKCIGLFFKIPIRRLFGANGMGIYTSAYSLYNIMFVIATAGLPVAISKMVSETSTKGNWKETKKVYKIARIILLAIGVVGTAILFFGSNFIADNMKISDSAMPIRALAPSLFFVAILSVNRGLCQGLSNMVPTAISETIEAMGKLVIGLGLAIVFLQTTGDVVSGVSGAILGVTTGTCIAAIYITIGSRNIKKHIYDKAKEDSSTDSASVKSLALRLAKLAIPITIGASVFTLASTIDLFMITRQLEGLGYSEAARTTMYGYYAGDAVTMFNMPPTVITALSVSIVPAIASAFVKHDIIGARKTTETAIRITLLFALPCAVGMSVLSAPILQLIMGDAGASTLLSILSYGIIFVCLVLVSNSVLQSMGQVWTPVIHMCIGGIVKVVVNYILVGNPQININGAPVGTVLCYLVTSMLNLISISKYLKPKYGIDFILKSALGAAIMGFAVYFIYSKMSLMGQGTLTMLVALGVSIAVGVILYFALLFITKAMKKQDIEFMPKSEKILKLVGRFL